MVRADVWYFCISPAACAYAMPRAAWGGGSPTPAPGTVLSGRPPWAGTSSMAGRISGRAVPAKATPRVSRMASRAWSTAAPGRSANRVRARCSMTSWSAVTAASPAGRQEGEGAKHEQGHRDEDGARGGLGRLDQHDEVFPDLSRDGDHPAADEEDDHELVERGDEGEEGAGQDAGPDVGQHDAHEALQTVRPETLGGALEREVEALERGRHVDDDQGDGEDGVRQDHAGGAPDEAEPRIQRIDGNGEDD